MTVDPTKWEQDPDGNWHRKPDELAAQSTKAVGIVVMLIVAAAAVAFAVWAMNQPIF